MIYLASPYSHSDRAVRVYRFELVCRAAAQLMAEGKFIYAPIAHTHSIALHGDLPGGFPFWEAYDRHMMDLSEALIVLMLDGWEASHGVQAEITYMTALRKPITYMEWITD